MSGRRGPLPRWSQCQKLTIRGVHREAAYTLTTYLEPREPWIEFDPPSPFSARRQHRQRLTLSEPGCANLNRDEGGHPNPSGPSSSSDLDPEGSPTSLTILELGSGTGIIIAKLAEIINKGATDVPTGQFQISLSLSSCLKSRPSLHPDDFLIATDLDSVCSLLDENLSSVAKESRRAERPSPRILVRPLEWGNLNDTTKIFNELGSRNLTHIICSDLVRYPDNSK